MNPAYSPASRYVLRGLETCWMPEQGMFSHAFRLYPQAHNHSIPRSDVFYTLNVLLGLSRLPDQGASTPWDLPALFSQAAGRLPDLPVPTYAYGMALWAAHEGGWSVPGRTLDALRAILDNRSGWSGFAAQDVGLLLSGLSHLARTEPEPWMGYARELMAFATEHFDTDSGLFKNNSAGYRARLATYATGVYMTLGHFHYGEAAQDPRAIERALLASRTLGSLQGPQGEWPWFYDAIGGRMVEAYQVYSVHQDGMAPAYLRLAAAHGMDDAMQQIRRGLPWVFGENELGSTMLDVERGLILRSHIRSQPQERVRRLLRGMRRSWLGRSGRWIGPEGLEILRECRSYHLGWVLWSFAGRDDFPEFTHHPQFVRALGEEAPC